jgi:hypothetical protein
MATRATALVFGLNIPRFLPLSQGERRRLRVSMRFLTFGITAKSANCRSEQNPSPLPFKDYWT